MWSEAAPRGRAGQSPLCVLLAQEVARREWRLDPEAAAVVKHCIQEFGEAEWPRFRLLDLQPLSEQQVTYLLGAGFALTKFFIAPLSMSDEERNRCCSLGALVNLMVVLCDRLLDSGSSVASVVPGDELAAGGGSGSIVMVLLRQYFSRVASGGADAGVRRTLAKAAPRMFRAEIETLRSSSLPHSAWVRKSALPFVLMALPAQSVQAGARPSDRSYVRWLYQAGRFFGAIDDAVDLPDDGLKGHPNCWQGRPESSYPGIVQRIGNGGHKILDDWDKAVPKTVESRVVRDTFLFNINEWLQPNR